MQGDLFAPTTPIKAGKWPSEQLHDLLTGKVQWDHAPPAITSWAAFYIHDAAMQVLAKPDKATRQAALAKITPSIRARVEVEATRLWRMG